jgi:hypothetical protein
MSYGIELTGYAFIGSGGIIGKAPEFRDLRITDRYSLIGLQTCHRLWNKTKCALIVPERLGVVLATKSGPEESIRRFANEVSSKGLSGVNPSLFPNIMLSTPLARLTITFGINGVCAPIYIQNSMDEATEYADVLIESGKCDSVILLFLECGKGGFALLLEKTGQCRKRGLLPLKF